MFLAKRDTVLYIKTTQLLLLGNILYWVYDYKDPHSAWHWRRCPDRAKSVSWDGPVPASKRWSMRPGVVLVGEGWRDYEVEVCVCSGEFGQSDLIPFAFYIVESCISGGYWEIWVYPWGDRRDWSHSSVSVLMTSLPGQTQFCWLLFFFYVSYWVIPL